MGEQLPASTCSEASPSQEKIWFLKTEKRHSATQMPTDNCRGIEF